MSRFLLWIGLAVTITGGLTTCAGGIFGAPILLAGIGLILLGCVVRAFGG